MNQSIAIVGAGFSGIATAYQLVHQADIPLTILIFEPSEHGLGGIAYSTNCPLHLLNVPTKNLSLFSDEPSHFLHWLQRYPQLWRNLHPSFKNLTVNENSFLPRMIYKKYLEHSFEQLEKQGEKKEISIKLIREKVQDINVENAHLLVDTAHTTFNVKFVVLATAIPWSRPLPIKGALLSSAKYLHALWPAFTDTDFAKKLLSEIPEKSSVGIIGSGLTMLDGLAMLKHLNYKSNIVVLSRRALLPQPHLEAAPLNHPISFGKLPRTALGLFKAIREWCRRARELQQDWRPLIDALRPYTIPYWVALPIAEKRKVIRYLFPLWNSFRHRAPQEAFALIQYFKASKQLSLHKANILSIKEEHDQIVVDIEEKLTNKYKQFRFDLLINCTGPNYELKGEACLLIHNLLAKRIVEHDALGMGLRLESDGSLAGKGKRHIFALGSLLFGSLFETTAVPEIRNQAKAIAGCIIKNVER